MRGFMFLLKIIAFILFCWYGNKLYKDIVSQEINRKIIIEKNTQDITDGVLIRKKDFFEDKEYEKNYKALKEKYRKKEEEKRIEEEKKLEEERRLEEEKKSQLSEIDDSEIENPDDEKGDNLNENNDTDNIKKSE